MCNSLGWEVHDGGEGYGKKLKCHVLADDQREKVALTWQNTDVPQSISAALKPVSEFTDIMSGEDYVTVSSLLLLFQMLKERHFVVIFRCSHSNSILCTGVTKLKELCSFQPSSIYTIWRIDTAVDDTKFHAAGKLGGKKLCICTTSTVY